MDKILHKIIHLITNNKDKKMIIGISGHGASGKTTFSNKVLDFYGKVSVKYITRMNPKSFMR